MSTVADGEKLKRAIKWISDGRTADPTRPIHRLIEEASIRFDLTPAEEQWLQTTFGD